jgi:hypothetical protein
VRISSPATELEAREHLDDAFAGRRGERHVVGRRAQARGVRGALHGLQREQALEVRGPAAVELAEPVDLLERAAGRRGQRPARARVEVRGALEDGELAAELQGSAGP